MGRDLVIVLAKVVFELIFSISIMYKAFSISTILLQVLQQNRLRNVLDVLDVVECSFHKYDANYLATHPSLNCTHTNNNYLHEDRTCMDTTEHINDLFAIPM